MSDLEKEKLQASAGAPRLLHWHRQRSGI